MATRSQNLRDSFHDLKNRIDASQKHPKFPPGKDKPSVAGATTQEESQPPNDDSIGHLMSTQESLTAQCIRHALHIYALTSLEGSLVGLTLPARDSQGIIRVLAETAIDIALSLADTCHASRLLWPVLVAGSCLIDRNYRVALMQGLFKTRYKMRSVETTQKILKLLWADEDPRVYGPHGVFLIREKHSLTLGWM